MNKWPLKFFFDYSFTKFWNYVKFYTDSQKLKEF